MIIKGRLSDYKVEWNPSGWSYAVPCVYVRSRIPIIGLKRWKLVYTGEGKGILGVERMGPELMEGWFDKTVYAYEEYKTEWDAFNKKATD